jgi:hypothetical protein
MQHMPDNGHNSTGDGAAFVSATPQLSDAERCKVVFTSAAHGAATRDGASDARGSATGGWATLGVRALRGCASHADSLFLQTNKQTNKQTNAHTHKQTHTHTGTRCSWRRS